jgi:DMSO/TMAO reductase YedYZ molybdopterin-dependent catalytic subunit
MMQRREFLRGLLAASASGLFAGRSLVRATAADPAGERLESLAFTGEGNPPLGQLLGSGLDGRRVFDLSALTPEGLITPADRFFVRTRRPEHLPPAASWELRIAVRDGSVTRRPVADLLRRARPMGTHLMECSGNTRYRRFGLMSAARWGGVPVTDVLREAGAHSDSGLVRITGFDPGRRGNGAPATASWIFTWEQLEESGAFLATEMNDQPLPEDNGHPVRLMVPGWYACAGIKWVHEITVLDEEARASRQMREYAGRTHQTGIPDRARDFRPAVIDQAAMPVRVERWKVGEGTELRVAGILWGGSRRVEALEIQFRPGTPFVPVERYDHSTNRTWTLWSHTWRPDEQGLYQLQMRIADRSVPTRRLDSGYYERGVVVQDL